jgi:hypothetical protein
MVPNKRYSNVLKTLGTKHVYQALNGKVGQHGTPSRVQSD